MKTLKGSGDYSVKSTGEIVQFEFEYHGYDNLADMVKHLTEGEVFALAQRQYKVDAGNEARVKARQANGHSLKPVLTEEQKAANKEKNKLQRSLFQVALAKAESEGITLEEYMDRMAQD